VEHRSALVTVGAHVTAALLAWTPTTPSKLLSIANLGTAIMLSLRQLGMHEMAPIAV
jgi:hypothetical protein